MLQAANTLFMYPGITSGLHEARQRSLDLDDVPVLQINPGAIAPRMRSPHFVGDGAGETSIPSGRIRRGGAGVPEQTARSSASAAWSGILRAVRGRHANGRPFDSPVEAEGMFIESALTRKDARAHAAALCRKVQVEVLDADIEAALDG